MAELMNMPPLFVIGLSVLAVGGLATIITQMFTLRRWNLAPLFYGLAMAALIWGGVLFTDELARTLLDYRTITDETAQHIAMADGVSTALSCVFVAGSTAGGLILVGAVLAYVREWMFREVL